MADVDLIRNNGKKGMNDIIGRHAKVQADLDMQAAKIWGKAEALMATHRVEHMAHVGIEKIERDRAIFLEDPPHGKWPGAAWAIETGHYAGPKELGTKREWVEGIWVLHDAIKRRRSRKR